MRGASAFLLRSSVYLFYPSTINLAIDTNLEIRVNSSKSVLSENVYIHVVQMLENMKSCAAGSRRQTQLQ